MQEVRLAVISDRAAFEDSASPAGITVDIRSGDSSTKKSYLLEAMTGGVCLLDYNNDGLLGDLPSQRLNS